MEVHPMMLRPSQGLLISDLHWSSAGARARDGRKHRLSPSDQAFVRVFRRRDRRAGRQEIATQLRDLADETDAINAELAAMYAEALEWQRQYEEEYWSKYDIERNHTTIHHMGEMDELIEDDWWWD